MYLLAPLCDKWKVTNGYFSTFFSLWGDNTIRSNAQCRFQSLFITKSFDKRF